MRYALILLLASLGLTGSQITDNDNTIKQNRIIPYRRRNPGFPLRRNSQGPVVPRLRSSKTVMSGPNERFFLIRPRGGSARDSRGKWSITRHVSPNESIGSSSLRGIGSRSSRNFRLSRFFAGARRNKTMPFRSNNRMTTPRLSITRKRWPRRINVPQMPFPREAGKRIHSRPGRFPPYPNKSNHSVAVPTFGDDAGSTRLTKPRRGSLTGRHGFRSPFKPRTGDIRELMKPAFHPKSPPAGISPRILNQTPLKHRFGSRLPPRSRAFHPVRKIHRRTRPIFKDSRSPRFRLPPGRIPFPYIIPSFRSFDRRLAPRNKADAAASYAAFKAAILLNRKSRLGEIDLLNPKNSSKYITTLLRGYSPAVTLLNTRTKSKDNGINNSERTIHRFTPGSEDGNTGNSVTTATESPTVSKESVPVLFTNHANIFPIGLSNSSSSSSTNAIQDSVSTIDSGRPNPEAPDLMNQDLPERKWNIEKQTGLLGILNTLRGLKKTTENGGSTPKRKQIAISPYANLISEVGKESPISDKDIAEMDKDAEWRHLLRVKDQVELEEISRRENNPKWPIDNLTKSEKPEDSGRLVTPQQKDEPGTDGKIMSALNNGFKYYNVFIADVEKNGESDHIFRASGIKFPNVTRQDGTSKPQNTATNKVKTQDTASNRATIKLSEVLNPVYPFKPKSIQAKMADPNRVSINLVM